MQVLHITPSTKGYEVVKLLANQVDRRNSFSVIERPNGDIHMTGGLIFEDTQLIRSFFESVAPDMVYELAQSLRIQPYVKMFYMEEEA